MALLNEINVKGVPHPIVTDDGYYQEMTVGDAEQLVATTFTEDDAPYNFRTAGGAIDIGDRKQVEGLIGGTVAWNQLQANNAGRSNSGITYTFNDGVLNIDGTATSTSWWLTANNIIWDWMKDHVYFIELGNDSYSYTYGDTILWYIPGLNTNVLGPHTFIKANQNAASYLQVQIYNGGTVNNVKYTPQVFDLTQMFGSTIADYIYSLEQANEGAGVAWFKKLFPKPYYAYNAGELMSVKALRHITRGFNAWDEEWELGYLDAQGAEASSTNNIRSKFFDLCIGGATYCIYNGTSTSIKFYEYDADKNYVDNWSCNAGTSRIVTTSGNTRYFKICTSAGVTTYNHDICINLSWDGERDGEYEEYVEHVYEFDPDLELRGIPKLSAGNNLYYDGDEYEPDGTVTRKYGTVDLGSLTWSYESTNHYFFTSGIGTTAKIYGWSICGKYGVGHGWSNADKAAFINNTNTNLVVMDSAYTDAASFKTAMSGVYLVYELATPTTEEADPYNGTQIVDDFGTEEFVDAGVAAETPTRDVAIPVGHNSLYQPNLRAKLEMVPEAPEDEGYYVVYHHNGINEYTPLIIPQELPELPTEDGTYTLKCTVANGSATLSFESEV